MKNDRFYIGNIKICTEYVEEPVLVMEDFAGVSSFGNIKTKNEIYKENALLVKTRNGLYIDTEDLSVLDIAYLYFENKKTITTGEPYMFSGSRGSYVGNKFVDGESLQPYVTKEEDKSKSTSLLSLRHNNR